MKTFWQEKKVLIVLSFVWLAVCAVAFFFSEEAVRAKVVVAGLAVVLIMWAVTSDYQFHFCRKKHDEDIHGA